MARHVALAGIAFLAAAIQAHAQQRPASPPQPPAPQAVPERTSASFGDWVMRCETVLEDGKARKVCEVFQGLQAQGQQGLIAQIAIGRLQKADQPRLTLVLPTNITLPSAVQVQIEEPDPQAIELPWRRCAPGGCVADLPLSEAQIQRLRGKSDRIRVVFRDSTNREITLIVSMKGFAQSYDAFLKE